MVKFGHKIRYDSLFLIWLPWFRLNISHWALLVCVKRLSLINIERDSTVFSQRNHRIPLWLLPLKLLWKIICALEWQSSLEKLLLTQYFLAFAAKVGLLVVATIAFDLFQADPPHPVGAIFQRSFRESELLAWGCIFVQWFCEMCVVLFICPIFFSLRERCPA